MNLPVGNRKHPEWLRLETGASEINIQSRGRLFGVVISPHAKVKIKGVLRGGLYAEKINGSTGSELPFMGQLGCRAVESAFVVEAHDWTHFIPSPEL